jgi:hypothetical protein
MIDYLPLKRGLRNGTVTSDMVVQLLNDGVAALNVLTSSEPCQGSFCPANCISCSMTGTAGQSWQQGSGQTVRNGTMSVFATPSYRAARLSELGSSVGSWCVMLLPQDGRVVLLRNRPLVVAWHAICLAF